MIQSEVIEKFVVRVNPAAFGYKAAPVSTRLLGHVKGRDSKACGPVWGPYFSCAPDGGLCRRHSRWRVLGWQRHPGACGSLRPATVIGVVVNHVPVSASLSETDLRILRCLLKSGARTEVPEIAKELCISEKTATRRLEKMKEGQLLDFSLQFSPAATAGYVHFCILIIAKKSQFRASMSACTQNFSTTS